MEQFCLALAIFLESRSEPLHGQIAVGQAILNRVQDRRWKNTVCEVIVEPKQISSMWDDQLSKALKEPGSDKAWQEARLIASALLSSDSTIHDYSKGAHHWTDGSIWRDWMWGSVAHRIGNHVWYVGVR